MVRLASIPGDGVVVPVPPPIAAAAGTDEIRPVWINQVGGITFQLGSGPSRRFAKWAPHGRGLDLVAEEARLGWAIDYAAVPRVLDSGSTADGAWLVTAGLPGRSAVDEIWRARPADAVRAIALALRHFHDTVPVTDCPFDWSVEARWSRSEKARAQDPAAPAAPPADRLVVCHGDPCAPNTLIGDDGHWTAHVDLDALGVADRWADLAVCSMSLGWNYGDGWEGLFFESYGVAPDPERIAFYRALWDAT